MASVTLTFSLANAARIQDALTESLDLDDPATVADYKNFLIAQTKQFVATSETRVAKAALAASSDILIT